jgi:hypothetical protein
MERVSTGRMMVITWCALPVAPAQEKTEREETGIKTERENTDTGSIEENFMIREQTEIV